PYRSIVARALAKDPNARQSRVYDLLPPGDAPREPEVRIIGDKKAGGAGANAGRPVAPPEEEILRIEAEEPGVYIGPDTRPPRREGPSLAQRLGATWRDIRRELREARRDERRAARDERRAAQDERRAMRDPPRNGVAAVPVSYQRRAP